MTAVYLPFFVFGRDRSGVRSSIYEAARPVGVPEFGSLESRVPGIFPELADKQVATCYVLRVAQRFGFAFPTLYSSLAS